MSIRNIKRYSLTLILALNLLGWNNATAQTPQQIMANIYKTYDSLSHFSFNVKYTFSTDANSIITVDDMLEGSYTIAGKKAKFNLGDIEFMQNDSFFISVYNNDKFILVADPRNSNTGSELPMRKTIDSLIMAYQQHYQVATSTMGDSGNIAFMKADSAAQFLKFQLYYDTLQNVLHSIEYVYEEFSSDTTLVPTPQNIARKLRIDFSNYRFDNFSESLYDENQYIFFEDGECKPVSKYKDYKIYYSRTGLANN